MMTIQTAVACMTMLIISARAQIAGMVEQRPGAILCIHGYVMDEYRIALGTLATGEVALERPDLYPISDLVDTEAAVNSPFYLLEENPPSQGSNMPIYSQSWQFMTNYLLIEHARQIGNCKTCSVNGSQVNGFKVEVKGIVMNLFPPTIDAYEVRAPDPLATPCAWLYGENVVLQENDRDTDVPTLENITSTPTNSSQIGEVTSQPSMAPSTPAPTATPSTPAPTATPTSFPTRFPTFEPTDSPTRSPKTSKPTDLKTEPSTKTPTTQAAKTQAETTQAAKTQAATTQAVTTQSATTQSATTQAATTQPPTRRISPNSAPSLMPSFTRRVAPPLNCSEYQDSFQVPDLPVSIHYVVNLKDEITQFSLSAQVVYEGEGWLAFGISPTGHMNGSSVIAGSVTSSSAVNPAKYFLGGHSRSTVSLLEEQTLKGASIDQNETHTVLTFRKLLEEEGELSINGNGTNTFIVAYGSSNQFGYHEGRASFELNLSWCVDDNDFFDPFNGTNYTNNATDDILTIELLDENQTDTEPIPFDDSSEISGVLFTSARVAGNGAYNDLAPGPADAYAAVQSSKEVEDDASTANATIKLSVLAVASALLGLAGAFLLA